MFTADFESLRQYECPDWFRDAKFGIWSHWGPQSVPMCGDWYARNMYIQGTEQYMYHLRHYGHPSEFGYKDICKLWKAENFDPDELMALYHEAGARYFVAQAMHHDHFFNYDSKLNRFNSVKVGPEKDICALWKAAAKKYDMPFGLTEHLGASFTWWRYNKGCDSYGPYKGIPYDGNDPEYRDFYLDNYEHLNLKMDGSIEQWYTKNETYHQYWLDVMKELIDKFQPELLYSDGDLPFGGSQLDHDFTTEIDPIRYRWGLQMLEYYYNKSIEWNGSNQAVYLQKDRRPEIYNVGILDIEKSQLTEAAEKPWHTDTCIGNWFYDAKQVYKKCDQVIEMLVDIVSKNGNMLLNILQKPDGTIDEEARYLLKELAGWMKICSEGIHGTRPWKIFGEGESRVDPEGFTERKTSWTPSDYRFTAKDNTVYAFIMQAPESHVCVVKSFAQEEIKSVELLGYGEVEYKHAYGVLVVQLPEELPTEYTNCLKITLV